MESDDLAKRRAQIAENRRLRKERLRQESEGQTEAISDEDPGEAAGREALVSGDKKHTRARRLAPASVVVDLTVTPPPPPAPLAANVPSDDDDDEVVIVSVSTTRQQQHHLHYHQQHSAAVSAANSLLSARFGNAISTALRISSPTLRHQPYWGSPPGQRKLPQFIQHKPVIPPAEPENPLILKCSICQEPADEKRGLCATTCGHVFCSPCLDESMKRFKRECPNCRASLKGKKSVIALKY